MRIYIDQGEVVRVHVDKFFDHEPGLPKMADGMQVHRKVKQAPYNVSIDVCQQLEMISIGLSRCSIAEQSILVVLLNIPVSRRYS
jgi:hypothetical protein